MIKSFDDSPFKGQSASDSNWLPIRDSSLPQDSPRPGSCSSDSKELSERSLNFIKGHSLMDKAVDNKHVQPLLVRTSLKERLAVIAVDPQVRTPAGDIYDVLYVGTTKGRVLKFISAKNSNAINDSSNPKPILIEEIQVIFLL